MKSLFLLTLLVATFFSGWTAHKNWHHDRVEEAALDGVERNVNFKESLLRAKAQGKDVKIDYYADSGQIIVEIEDKARD